MDAVVVEESQIEDRWHVEHAGELQRRKQLLASHGLNACDTFVHVLVVKGDHFRDCPGLLGWIGHIELQVRNAREELDIGIRQVPGEFLR